MNRHTPCPDSARLKGLLDSSLPEEEQPILIGHLDVCESCQQSLEELATGNSFWPEAVAHADRDRPPATSAFWPALHELEDELAAQTVPPTPAPAPAAEEIEALSLDFLQPAEDPTYLGRLGHFDVVEVIGRGGMGVVLKAYDGCLQRPVAIKVLDPKVAHSEMARKRFCREARAAAAIAHENVVTILQVEREESNDLPFLVMQLVNGESLQDRLDHGTRLSLEEVLRIGQQTAAGLAAAHAQGLIHRDIKPANILLENGVERVKLTDFGLARAADNVKLTQTGFVAGTPLYMAPEQARGEPVDHRADLFSFGSVLYALCTGQPPFGGSTPFVVLKNVTEERPRPIREVNSDIPEWLCDVVDRLHAKAPADRIQSAAEVAELFARHLAQLRYSTEALVPMLPVRRVEPVRTPSRRRRFWLLAVAVPLVLVGGLALTEATGLTRIVSGLIHPAPKLLIALKAETGPVRSVAFTPDGQHLASGLDNGTVKIWDLPGGELRKTFNVHKGAVWCAAFSPDGQTLATGGSDMKVRLWDPDEGVERQALDKHAGAVRALAYSADGKHLVVGDLNGGVTVWDLAGRSERPMGRGHDAEVAAVAFSPDGTTVASGGKDELVRVWDVVGGREKLSLRGHKGGVYTVAFSPDGKLLASGGWDKEIRLWDVATGQERAVLKGHEEDIWSVAFSPNGKLLASTSEDRTMRLWDVAASREVSSFRGHTGALYAVRFSPDGTMVAAGGRDGVVRLWEVPGR